MADSHVFSQTVKIADLSLSNSADTTVDTFLFVANDVGLHDGYVLFDAASTAPGTMLLSLVTNRDQGEFLPVSGQLTITVPSREPQRFAPGVRLIQTGKVLHRRPVYLRVTSSPRGSATPWWASDVTLIHLTLHLLNRG